MLLGLFVAGVVAVDAEAAGNEDVPGLRLDRDSARIEQIDEDRLRLPLFLRGEPAVLRPTACQSNRPPHQFAPFAKGFRASSTRFLWIAARPISRRNSRFAVDRNGGPGGMQMNDPARHAHQLTELREDEALAEPHCNGALEEENLGPK